MAASRKMPVRQLQRLWHIGLINGSKQGGRVFTDSYNHMECLGGMRLQSFRSHGHFVYPCNPGYPS